MPISREHRIVFVHIPKTSGTYVEASFGMHGRRKLVGLQETRTTEPNQYLWGAECQHLTVSELRGMLPSGVFERFFKFSIVRDPYDRLVSEVAWRSGYKSWQTEHVMTQNAFRQGLRAMCDSWRKGAGTLRSDRHLMPQHLFLMDEGNIAVDRVFRFEEYAEIDAFIRDVGGMPPKQKRMVSQRLETEAYLTREIKEMVYEIYREDFRLFGYATRI